MAKNLKVGIIIGAAISSGFRAAFGSTKRLSDDLTRAITKANRAQKALGMDISRGFANGTGNLRKMTTQYRNLNTAIEKAHKSQNRLNMAVASHKAAADNRKALRGQMIETAGHGMAIGLPVWSSVKTFMRQEEAATMLKIAMMDAVGNIGRFNEVAKEAIKIGNILPGTTEDFLRMAYALKTQGISDDKLIKGGLLQAARLSIVMETGQEFGAEFFAKTLEAFNIGEEFFEKAADLTQRAKFGGGLKSEDMYAGMKYVAPTMNTMQLGGIENYEKYLAIQSMAAKKGLEGSTFGTSLNMMLLRLAKGPKLLELSNRGMKAEAKDMLDKSGVKFEFFDKKGGFKGLEGMIEEIGKLKIIEDKFGQEGSLLVANEMFGVEAGRPAQMIAQSGLAGFKAELEFMRKQGDLQARINERINTLGASLEQLGGVAEQAFGAFGSAFKDDIASFAKTSQAFIEDTLHPWINANKPLIVGTIKVIGILIGMKLATLGIAYAVSSALSPFKMLWVAAAKFGTVYARFNLFRAAGGFSRMGHAISGTVKVALRLGQVMGGVLLRGIMLVGKSILFIGRALLMNPIGLAIAGIAAAAYLIYKYWEPIKGFFSRLWESVKGFFNSGIGNITKTILDWSPIGLFHQAFAAVLSWFGIDIPSSFTEFGAGLISNLAGGINTAWEAAKGIFSGIITFIKNPFSSLSVDFTSFGANILEGLVGGITSKMQATKDKIIEVGSSIKNWFTSVLGIKSPSRVFMGYGDNITMGAAIGIEQGLPHAKKAITRLSNEMQLSNQNGLQRHFSDAGNNTQSGGINITFNPTIHAKEVTGVEKALKLSLKELEVMLERLDYQRKRRSFA